MGKLYRNSRHIRAAIACYKESLRFVVLDVLISVLIIWQCYKLYVTTFSPLDLTYLCKFLLWLLSWKFIWVDVVIQISVHADIHANSLQTQKMKIWSGQDDVEALF